MTKTLATAEVISLKTGDPADLSMLSIPELKLAINAKWKKIDKVRDDLAAAQANARSREHDLVLQVGMYLLELRKRVEDGEAGDEAALSWWEWYEANFAGIRTRRNAERCMQAASAANPIAYRQAEKEAQRERMRKYRDTMKRGVEAVANASVKPQEHNFGLTSHVRRNAKVSDRPIYNLVEPPDPDIDHEKVDRIMGILGTCNAATLQCFADEFYKFMRDR